MADKKTVIVTGASQGIGAATARAFLDRGYNVVATARSMSGAGFAASANLVVVDGDIGQDATAEKVVKAAMDTFGAIDHVVNCAGIFKAKPFTDYTIEEFRAFVSVNLEGFVFLTQRAVRQMLAQGRGGSVTVNVSGTLVSKAAVPEVMAGPSGSTAWAAAVAMITKGGLNTVTRCLANEYAKSHIRFNAVAPGVVNTPLHKGLAMDAGNSRSPMGTFSEATDIAAAVIYLTEAEHVTGEILYVDDGAHVGRW